MTKQDIKPNAKVRLQNGTTFIIESLETVKGLILVTSALEGGAKGNYRTELSDAVLFFNENKAIIL